MPELPLVAAVDTLTRVLARQQLLLVLDNCEHLLGAAAQLCAGLLAACDDVRVLATSREPLRIAVRRDTGTCSPSWACRTGLRSASWSSTRSSEVLATGTLDRRQSIDKETAELDNQLQAAEPSSVPAPALVRRP